MGVEPACPFSSMTPSRRAMTGKIIATEITSGAGQAKCKKRFKSKTASSFTWRLQNQGEWRVPVEHERAVKTVPDNTFVSSLQLKLEAVLRFKSKTASSF